MKVLLSWLREFAPIEGDPVALGEEMSDLGMAVEDMEILGEELAGVVVAKVLDLRPHPDADRIQLVDVDRGDGEALQVCCGAFNMQVGDLVPLATLGTVMPNGMAIERRKMRGEWSNGMLCASDELGMGDDHSGIMILDPSLDLGVPLADALGLSGEVLYDLEINPNRPDAMSVAGVARDLAARLGVPFSIPQPAVSEVGAGIDGTASVEIIAPDLCGRFLVRVLRDVTIGSSPAWLVNRLRAGGMRPINSVVDVSNYVMLELGQPNHTYDFDLVPGGHLGTRWAREGETIVTLDGVERTLTAADGVIVDSNDEAIGIAGVMGGASTEISESTSSVLLEMAWWDPMSIARTSSRLGLRSEASMRFERGTDPEIAELAAARFAELLAASGATLAPGIVDVRGNLPDRSPIRVRTSRVNTILGTKLVPQSIADYLVPIGFECTAVGDDQDIVVPSFRPDTTAEIDVIEEIARHFGYSAIGHTVPKASAGRLSERQIFRRQLQQILVGAGVSEAMPMPFLAPGDLDLACVESDAVVVTNPLDARESVLRTSLRPGLLKALAYNASHRNPGAQLFEIGRVFHRPPGVEVLPTEPEHVGVILGEQDARAGAALWHVMATALGVEGASIRPSEAPGLHPTRSAILKIDGHEIGVIGEIDPGVLDAFEAPGPAAWLELSLDGLEAASRAVRTYERVSTFPSSDLDLAFEVAEEVPAGAVADAIRGAAADLLTSLELFDVYRGDRVAPGTRSLAYRLRLQAPDRTLTDAEIGELRDDVIRSAESVRGVKLRG
jgi:phenylalanyl-tRNA synthetase beta chain